MRPFRNDKFGERHHFAKCISWSNTSLGWMCHFVNASLCQMLHLSECTTLQMHHYVKCVTWPNVSLRQMTNLAEGIILPNILVGWMHYFANASLSQMRHLAICIALSNDSLDEIHHLGKSVTWSNAPLSLNTFFQGHFDSLWGIACHVQGDKKNQFLSAGFDGRAILWDSEYHKPVWTK